MRINEIKYLDLARIPLGDVLYSCDYFENNGCVALGGIAWNISGSFEVGTNIMWNTDEEDIN
jgi:hypothetical protein